MTMGPDDAIRPHLQIVGANRSSNTSIEKVVRIHQALEVHRSDIARGLRAIENPVTRRAMNVHVREALRGNRERVQLYVQRQVQEGIQRAAASTMAEKSVTHFPKTRLRLTIEEDQQIRRLQEEAGMKIHEIVNVALLCVAADGKAPSWPHRKIADVTSFGRGDPSGSAGAS